MKGQEHVKRALKVAAAGAHNILMVGPPDVPPSDTVVVLVPMLAPTTPGLYRDDWSLRDPEDAIVPVSSRQTIWAKVFVAPPDTRACTTDDAVASSSAKTIPTIQRCHPA